MQAKERQWSFVIELVWLVLAWCAAYWIRFQSHWFAPSKGVLSFQQFSEVFWFSLLAFFLTECLHRPLFSLSFSPLSRSLIYLKELIFKEIHFLFLLVSLLFFFRETIFSRLSVLLFAVIWPLGVSLTSWFFLSFRSFEKKKGFLLHSKGVLPQAPSYLEQKYDLTPCLLFDRPLDRYEIPFDHQVFILTSFDRLPQEIEKVRAFTLLRGNALSFLIPKLEQKDYAVPIFFSGQRLGAYQRLDFQTPHLNGSELWLKRLFDIVLSFSFLVVSFPLCCLIALLVKITSRGPLFYAQERLGLDGRVFRCYKFRSMKHKVDGEDQRWSTVEDPRRTKVGVYLRKFSLDELPQFWNVLKGDMSLVGPRPEQPLLVEKFSLDHPGYSLRLKMKAGLTGWAQIQGWRGDTSLTKRIAADMWYLENWSIWLDLYIVFLTPYKILVGENAH